MSNVATSEPAPAGDARLEQLKERLKVAAPYVGYTLFFSFALIIFTYLTFPWERVRDKIVSEFEHGQHPGPGQPRQTLTIGSFKPSWFTGAVLTDVVLTTVPTDPSKPPSVTRIDELRVRVSLGSLFSPAKDLSFQIHAMGGTIEGTVTNVRSAERDATPTVAKKNAVPGKDDGPKYDRTIRAELEGIDVQQITAIRDAIGAPVGGTLKGKIDLTLGSSRVDHATGTLDLEIADLWVSDGKVPFKIPALKAFFGSEDITLPQISIGTVPVQISVKSGVAKFDKMSAAGKDLDLGVEGQITLRELLPESDAAIAVHFKFNDTYRKKGDATAGLLLALDSEPKLRAGKRADGFYGLKMIGPIGGNAQ
ncbi:MAG: type II secretion system protein GspN, partial [Polyangiales bacterium]